MYVNKINSRNLPFLQQVFTEVILYARGPVFPVGAEVMETCSVVLGRMFSQQYEEYMRQVQAEESREVPTNMSGTGVKMCL